GKSQLSPSLTSLALSIGQGMFRFSPAIPLNTDLSTGERVSLLAGIGEPPLHSPPPTVPAQYRQEIPQQSVSPPPPVTAEPTKVGMGFYLQWVLVNVAGLIAGFFMGAIAQTLLQSLGKIISDQVLAATMGLTIGYMQAIILRRQIPISEKQWIWGTTFGSCISLLLSGHNSETTLLWIGPVVGTIQWWIMRPVIKQAGWWILVNTLLGWIGGIFSGAVLVLLLRNANQR
ncbi:MAG TPA: hypothetical protein V6D25_28815, partial [Leptolyngbyaceae cyanobacterium]